MANLTIFGLSITPLDAPATEKVPWSPVQAPPGFRAVPYEKVSKAGGTFFMGGEFWRAFEGGYRRQMGRAPKALRPHFQPTDLVWMAI
jgi:hypothetical protein